MPDLRVRSCSARRCRSRRACCPLPIFRRRAWSCRRHSSGERGGAAGAGRPGAMVEGLARRGSRRSGARRTRLQYRHQDRAGARRGSALARHHRRIGALSRWLRPTAACGARRSTCRRLPRCPAGPSASRLFGRPRASWEPDIFGGRQADAEAARAAEAGAEERLQRRAHDRRRRCRRELFRSARPADASRRSSIAASRRSSNSSATSRRALRPGMRSPMTSTWVRAARGTARQAAAALEPARHAPPAARRARRGSARAAPNLAPGRLFIVPPPPGGLPVEMLSGAPTCACRPIS